MWPPALLLLLSGRRSPTCSLPNYELKGEQFAAVYYNKMKDFADEMIAAGKPLEDEDFISYIMACLDRDYNSFVENVTEKKISLLVLCTPSFWQPRLGLNCRMHHSINPRLTLPREDVAAFVAAVDDKETVVAAVLVVVLEGTVKLGPPLDLDPCVNFAKRLATRFNGAGRDSTATSLVKINM
jgi:hypothetical protein